MAQNVGKLFLPNRGMSPFYAACCFDVLRRGSVLCLFATSLGRVVFTTITCCLCAKFNDPGGHQGNTVQIVAWWRHQVASNVA
jgi:hypothetical protein